MQQQQMMLHTTSKASSISILRELVDLAKAPYDKDLRSEWTLDEDQQRVLDACLEGRNVFYSGMGGTGELCMYVCMYVCFRVWVYAYVCMYLNGCLMATNSVC